MIGRDEFRRLADIALDASRGAHTVVSLGERRGGTARFANNQIVQHVNTYRHELTIRVSRDGRSGRTATTELSPRAIAAATARAEEIARVSPPDPEYLPPLPAQEYPERETYSEDTATADPARLIRDARESIRICQAADLEGAGIVSAYAASSGVAASTGLFAHEHHTRAEFSLTATGADSSGWVKNANRSIDRLGVVDRAHKAVDKAKRSANPKEVPAGRYTVILEPAAVSGLLGPLNGALNAKAYYRGTSALSGKLDQPVVDARLTLRNDPRHPALLGRGFSEAGLPSDEATWIEKGVLRRLDHDRFTAQEQGVEPSYALDAPHLAVENPTADLVKGTERGIYVTNFWYIRFVNRTDLTLTGMTRDGTFLVEDGRIATGLINFRWHESPLRAFNQVVACSRPTDSITMERTKMWLPAMKIRDFNFSSVTRF